MTLRTYSQVEFDNALREILTKANANGELRRRVVSRELHDIVVDTADRHANSAGDHRLPMACNAMWKLWKEQGCREEAIINNTPSGKSNTIEIEFETTARCRKE